MKRMFCITVLAVLCLFLLAACGAGNGGSEESSGLKGADSGPEYTEYSDLSGKTVSMLTGAPFEDLVLSKAPDVGEFTFFSNMPDMILALESGKTDAVLNNNAIASLAVNRDPGIVVGRLQHDKYIAESDPVFNSLRVRYKVLRS